MLANLQLSELPTRTVWHQLFQGQKSKATCRLELELDCISSPHLTFDHIYGISQSFLHSCHFLFHYRFFSCLLNSYGELRWVLCSGRNPAPATVFNHFNFLFFFVFRGLLNHFWIQVLIAAHAKTFKINFLLLLEVFLYLLLDSLGYPLLCLLRIRKAGTASLVKSAVCEQITFPLNQLKENCSVAILK